MAVFELYAQMTRTMCIVADDSTAGSANDAVMAALDENAMDAPPFTEELDAGMGGGYVEDTEQLLREAEELLRAAEDIEEV